MSVSGRVSSTLVVAVALLVCALLPTAASAETDSFGPALPVPLTWNYGLSAHNLSENEWTASGAFEQQGRPRAAPISGTLSQIRLEYGTPTGMEVQIWTANGATGALGQLVDTLQLQPTGGGCGGEPKVETVTPNIAISSGEVLVLLNSDEKGDHICLYPEGMTEGYFGRFGETFTPETGKAPSGWSLQNNLGIALEGTVTNEPGGSPGGGSPGGGTSGGGTSAGSSGSSAGTNTNGSSGGTTSTNITNTTNVITICGKESSCTISVGANIYTVTINPGNKAVFTKVPGAYELPINCNVAGQPSCIGESGSYCSCSVPFGTISRAHAPKQTLLGRASFDIPAGHTGKVKFKLTAAGRAILRAKHVLHATVVTTMKLPGGKTATIKSKITIKLKH